MTGRYSVSFSIVHQFCRIGQHCFTGMGSVISKRTSRRTSWRLVIRRGHGINSEGCTGAASPLSRSPQSNGPTRRSIPPRAAAGDCARADSCIGCWSDELRVMAEFLAVSERSIVR